MEKRTPLPLHQQQEKTTKTKPTTPRTSEISRWHLRLVILKIMEMTWKRIANLPTTATTTRTTFLDGQKRARERE